jgi:phosphatidylinositol alpha-1,6-mannosyltransferase
LALLYLASDLFALCTQELPAERAVEGFGLAFLEAQACGTPAVGTRSGGIAEALSDGDGGWLVQQNDSGVLAGILRQLVYSPETLRLAGEQARRRVLKAFTWHHYMTRFSEAMSRSMVHYD